jgi:uncharacterized circularly permuted ATP-grasp superfamily protein
LLSSFLYDIKTTCKGFDFVQKELVELAKWKLHRFYAANPAIAKYLPPTTVFNPTSLSAYMEKYKTLYIKGNTQHTGVGIIKAWKSPKGYKYVHVRGKVNTAPSIQDLHDQIRQIGPKRIFIIQKAVDLARINGRPYDIRVMMMRDGKRKWQYAGMIAKVFGQGSIISNVNRGRGYATTVDEALAESLKIGSKRVAAIKKELIELSHHLLAYSEKYPVYSFQSGIDLAVDKNGKIWIIEVNLHNPSHGLFNRLTDKTFFKRIKKLYFDYLNHNQRII